MGVEFQPMSSEAMAVMTPDTLWWKLVSVINVLVLRAQGSLPHLVSKKQDIFLVQSKHAAELLQERPLQGCCGRQKAAVFCPGLVLHVPMRTLCGI